MYFSRIALADTAGREPGFQETFRTPYTLHRSLWGLFSDHPERDRDFLYRVEFSGRRPVVYSLSEREPFDGRGFWKVESKPFRPVMRRGMRLGFDLRVNPVVSRRDEDGRQSRHDVVMDAKHRLREKKGGRGLPTQAELVQSEAFAWLDRRTSRGGFDVSEGGVVAEGYVQHRFKKGRGEKARRVSLSTVDLKGVLTVTDPDVFTETLRNGLGPAKGFGCGLMMIRRV